MPFKHLFNSHFYKKHRTLCRILILSFLFLTLQLSIFVFSAICINFVSAAESFSSSLLDSHGPSSMASSLIHSVFDIRQNVLLHFPSDTQNIHLSVWSSSLNFPFCPGTTAECSAPYVVLPDIICADVTPSNILDLVEVESSKYSSISEKIAVIQHDPCSFYYTVLLMQRAGALAVVFNKSLDLFGPASHYLTDDAKPIISQLQSLITIPVLFVSQPSSDLKNVVPQEASLVIQKLNLSVKSPFYMFLLPVFWGIGFGLMWLFVWKQPKVKTHQLE